MNTPTLHQERFEAWLFSQPDERRWDYRDTNACAVCSFIHETTSFSDASVGGGYWISCSGADKLVFPRWLYDLETMLLKTLFKGKGHLFSAAQLKAIYISLHGNPIPNEIPLVEAMNAE